MLDASPWNPDLSIKFANRTIARTDNNAIKEAAAQNDVISGAEVRRGAHL
jgi:hypothetical protein